MNPTDPRCELRVRYTDGTIESDDQALDTDLNQTLNLNFVCLKNNRKAVLVGLVEAMRLKYSATPWTEADLKREIAALQQFNSEGKLKEYCQVMIYWLRKRLGRLAHSGRA